MSVACSTTQSSSVEREESAHMSQISPAAKNPQSLQERIDRRVSVIAREICSGSSLRAPTIQSAIRSAERGPTPGICRSCAIKFRIATGYSVLLKARSAFFQRRFRQLQNKRLQPAQIELQGRIVFPLGSACFLKFRISFRPTFFPIQNHAAPERISTRDMLRFGFRGKPEWLVDFKSVVRIGSAHKINWPRDDCLAHVIESRRINQDLRSIPVIQGTESAREFNWFAARQERRMYAVP